MLRTCLAAAAVDGTVSVFLEPIALYHTADLHEPGDRGWLDAYDPPDRWGEQHVPIGSARLHGEGGDLLIVTWANGLHLSLRVARRLSAEGVGVRVLDLRWLAPLPIADVVAQARATGRVLVVDETRRTGGVGEGVVTGLVEHGFDGRIGLVASRQLHPARERRRPACWCPRTRSPRWPPAASSPPDPASGTCVSHYSSGVVGTKMRLAPDARRDRVGGQDHGGAGVGGRFVTGERDRWG